MIYAETERMVLRPLERGDLQRLAELIGDWEVARWLSSVPFPYGLRDAEAFYERMQLVIRNGGAEYFLLQRKIDGAQLGAIGLHPSREPEPLPGERVMGYWLGRDYWAQGLMQEAIAPVIDHAFARAEVAVITATTDPANAASQKVLRKAGFAYLGISPYRDAGALRGTDRDATRWRLTRADHDKGETA